MMVISSTGDVSEELVDSFFEAEVEMERKICRDVVCTSHKDEEGKNLLTHTHNHTCTRTPLCQAGLSISCYRPRDSCIRVCLCVFRFPEGPV